MEAAAGGQLGEERAKLHELQLALGGLGLAQQAKPAALNDDLAIAGELDKLQQQLEAVEQQIAAADSGTKALLAQSAAKWAGDDAPGSDEDGEAAADGSGAGGSSSGAGAGAAEGAGGAVAPSAVDAMLASGLLPVAEAGDGEEEVVEHEGPAAAAGPSAPPGS
ncbi:hypothetical protein HYH03_014428 [Edaphochlamys debaryana]|uniref:Uncharacterized protein n=1 Tax=Edaphochlamys debaryana TaxID=47281 RepID=A0A835XNS0_9CHLO|nr:hypothetical protein HYH03_014428 [Edaphochlamys debaryana]|eukprot:KAG2486929.1 hypothetical protein HYH03_014428 [Edaphochlamys debaryana]